MDAWCMYTDRAGAAETEVGEEWEGETGVETDCWSAWDESKSNDVIILFLISI